MSRGNRGIEDVDVLVIGSGAGGSPLAFTFSKQGYEVLVLEKGPRYNRTDYRHDELLLINELGMFVPRISEDPHVMVKPNGTSEVTSFGWIASCVGGGTAHMGGSLYRFHPDDFVLNTLELIDGAVDWPYSYGDLEPYYCTAERYIGVAGRAGVNPFEGSRSQPYPLPPLEDHYLSSHFDSTAQSLGLHSFPTPKAINSRPYQGRPQCSYCKFCAGFGCPTGARGSTQETLLYLAEQRSNCRVRPLAMAHTIDITADGRAAGCTYFDSNGGEHKVHARVVCVCCSAVESARLLLLSRSGLFPDGLANSEGLIGKNLQFVCSSGAKALVDTAETVNANDIKYMHSIGRSIMDYYFPNSATGLRKGGTLKFETFRSGPIAIAQRLASSGSGPLLWGAPLRAALEGCCKQPPEIDLEAFHDFICNRNTYVDIDPQVTDRWGLPVARIHVDDQFQHVLVGRFLIEKGREVLDALGATYVRDPSFGSINHNLVYGTCRAGTNPKTSVLNSFCQSHEVPNLFVVDGSFMPTSAGVPGTLTILANSFRVADYITEQVQRRNL
jgi:choline dehydrogenase-like flavoprotein